MNKTDQTAPTGGGTERLPRLGFLLLGAIALLWGVNWPIMKIALSEIQPWTFRAICVLGGGSGMLVAARIAGLPLIVPVGERKFLLLAAGFNVTAWHLLTAFGIRLMPSGRASIIAFTMALWATLLAWPILGQKPSLRQMIGLGLGLGGLAALVWGELAAMGQSPLGLVLMISAAVAWASGTLVVKNHRWTMPVLVMTGWQLLLGGGPIFVGALILESPAHLADLTVGPALALAYVVLVAILFCQYAWFKTVSLFPAQIAAVGAMMTPVVGVFSGALILGERLGLPELVALGLVLAAQATAMGLIPGRSARKS